MAANRKQSGLGRSRPARAAAGEVGQRGQGMVKPGALTAVAVAAMLLAAGGPAYAGADAATLGVGADGTLSTQGYVVSTAGQTNGNAINSTSINANLTGVTGGTSVTGSPTNATPVPVTNTNTSNGIGAYATGNSATNQVNLPAIGAGAGNGIAALTFSANAPAQGDTPAATTINSAVSNSSLAQTVTDDTAGGSLSQASNLVTAQTTGNVAGSTVSGPILSTYTGPAVAGNVSLNPTTGKNPEAVPLTASANVAVGTVQLNDAVGQGTGSSALLTDNGITQTVNSSGTVPETLSVNPTQTGNTLSAVFTGNSATNSVSASAQDNPTLAGSIAVGNEQVNAGSASVTGTPVPAAAANTDSIISTTIASGGEEDAAPITLGQSSVALQNNTISSSATGNSAVGTGTTGAGNSIALAGGLNLSGSVTAPTNTVSDASGATLAADLALANLQVNDTAPLGSTTTDGSVAATVQNSTGSTIGVAGNAITASTAGNNASSAITAPSTSDAGTASISGSVALANGQSNRNSPLSATVSGNQVSATLGTDGSGAATGGATVTGTNASITGSTVQASVYGSEAANSVSANADTITTANAPAALTSNATSPFVQVSGLSSAATAGLSLNNGQVSSGSAVTATNTGSTISLTANSVAPQSGNLDDQLSISGGTSPTIDAIALSNMASNSLSAAATTLSGSTGLTNAQVDASGATASLANPSVALAANTTSTAPVSGSSLTVGTSLDGATGAGNTLRAIGYGNQATNTLSASADTFNVPLAGEDATVASTVGADGVPSVNAATGLLSTQSSNAPVSSSVSATAAPLTIQVGAGGVSDSTVANAGNAVVASAYGNQVANSASVAATNLVQNTAGTPSEAVYTPLASVTSVQSATGGVTSTITGPALGNLFSASIAGAAVDSTLGVSNNTSLAQAEGNQASGNSLAVSGTNIADVSPAALGGLSSGGVAGNTADLAFTVQNGQTGTGNVAATQTGTGAQLAFGADVTGSGGQVQGNQFRATAYNNTATGNTLTIGTANAPVTTLAASGGVQNVQNASGATTATVGAPGTAGSPGVTIGQVPYSVASGDNSAALNGTTLTVSGSPLVFNLSGLSLEQRTAFEELVPGGTVSGNSYTFAAGTYQNVQQNAFGAGVSQLYFVNGSPINNQYTQDMSLGGIGATPATPLVQITAAGNITNSTLSANGNSVDATAIANNAANQVSVNATAITPGAGVVPGTAQAAVGTTITALADYTASNNQVATGSTTANASGEVSISDSATQPVISGSTLSVSNNTQQASAEANLATTTLSVASANSTGATGALVSNQNATGTVSALSGDSGNGANLGQILQAPGAISGSSLAISGNTNAALGVANDATNTVSISGTNVSGANTGVNATASKAAGAVTAQADYSLTNVQSVANTATVSASASSQVLNNDSVAAATSGVSNSSVALNNNVTQANAYANRASNTLNLSGTNTSATGALVNSQGNAAPVTATTASTVVFSLEGQDATPAASGSSIAVNDNTLQAQAVGNQATNALNATPSSAYGTQGAPATGTSVAGLNAPGASASYALLNQQSNSAAVTATGTSGSGFAVALNGGGSSSPVAGSTLSVQGNTANVAAFGNSASNTLTLAALNTGNATGALNSVQSNSGNVTAIASNLNFGVNVGGPGAVGSSLTVGGNSITARAVGNTVSNTVAAR